MNCCESRGTLFFFRWRLRILAGASRDDLIYVHTCTLALSHHCDRELESNLIPERNCSSMASNELVLHWLQKTCDLTPPHFIAGNSTQKHCIPKRKRSLDSIMQENNASDSSRSPNKRSRTQSETLSGLPKPFATLSTRTKLTPKTQVSSSTRPESPSKDLTFLLRESIPCIICEQPDAVVWTGTMTELAGQLNKKLEEGVIPIALKVYLDHGMDPILIDLF